MSARLQWNGDALKAKALQASKLGIDKTMSACVIDAKRTHPGWHNRTGAAEGSIRIVTFAEAIDTRVRGLWGSADIDYMIWLELKHGSALRAAADRTYPRLAEFIAGVFRG